MEAGRTILKAGLSESVTVATELDGFEQPPQHTTT